MPWYLCFSHLMTGSFAPGEAATFGNLQAEKGRKASKAQCNWEKEIQCYVNSSTNGGLLTSINQQVSFILYTNTA